MTKKDYKFRLDFMTKRQAMIVVEAESRLAAYNMALEAVRKDIDFIIERAGKEESYSHLYQVSPSSDIPEVRLPKRPGDDYFKSLIATQKKDNGGEE